MGSCKSSVGAVACSINSCQCSQSWGRLVHRPPELLFWASRPVLRIGWVCNGARRLALDEVGGRRTRPDRDCGFGGGGHMDGRGLVDLGLGRFLLLLGNDDKIGVGGSVHGRKQDGTRHPYWAVGTRPSPLQRTVPPVGPRRRRRRKDPFDFFERTPSTGFQTNANLTEPEQDTHEKTYCKRGSRHVG